MEQQEFIKTARTFLGSSVVKHNEMPKWFRKLITKYGKEHGIVYPNLRLVCADIARKLKYIRYDASWIDHCGTGKGFYANSPKDCFISEPYGISNKCIRVINELCKEMNLNYYIDANSYWFPGKTIRILIHPDLSYSKPW